MKLLAHLLIVTILFSSCTAYKYSITPDQDNDITLQDLEPIEVGHKLITVSRSGLRKKGRLLSINENSLKMSVNSTFNNPTYDINLNQLKRINFEEDKGRTIGNTVTGAVLGVGVFIILLFDQFDKAYNR